MPDTHRITLTQLRYFCRTAELGSMNDVAAEQFVSQSTISTSIGQLEKNLGVQLLNRHRSKGVSPTAQGELFYTRALQILDDVEAAVGEVSADAVTGTLSLGCFTTIAPFWMPEIIAETNKKYPGLELSVSELAAEQIAEELREKRIPFALTYSFEYGNDIAFVPLAAAPLYALVANTNPLATQTEQVTLEQLAQQQLILLDMDKSAEYFLSVFSSSGLTPVVHQKYKSFELVRSMVAHSSGYTLLNQLPQHDLTYDGQKTTAVKLPQVSPTLYVGIAHLKTVHMSARIQAVIDICKAVAKNK